MGRFQVDDSSISNQLREKKKKEERKRSLRITGWSSFRKKNFVFRKKNERSVYVNYIFPQIRICDHKIPYTNSDLQGIYRRQTDLLGPEIFQSSYFPRILRLGYGFSALIFFFPLVLSSGSRKRHCVSIPGITRFSTLFLFYQRETETAGPAKGREPWGCCASPRQCMNYEM